MLEREGQRTALDDEMGYAKPTDPKYQREHLEWRADEKGEKGKQKWMPLIDEVCKLLPLLLLIIILITMSPLPRGPLLISVWQQTRTTLALVAALCGRTPSLCGRRASPSPSPRSSRAHLVSRSYCSRTTG